MMSTIRRIFVASKIRNEVMGSFIYDFCKEGWRGVTKFWAILQIVSDGFREMGYFSDSVYYFHAYEQKMPFFHHILNFLTIAWLLLHCFHPEISFAVNL